LIGIHATRRPSQGDKKRGLYDPPTAEASRTAIDEKQIEIDNKKWLCASVDTKLKISIDINVYSRREIDLVALKKAPLPSTHQKSMILEDGFLHRLTEKHDLSHTEFLVDVGGYLTVLFRHELIHALMA